MEQDINAIETSSGKEGLRLLAHKIKPRLADRILWELVNLADKDFGSFMRRFRERLPAQPRELRMFGVNFSALQDSDPELLRALRIDEWRANLRNAWSQRTTLERELYVRALFGRYCLTAIGAHAVDPEKLLEKSDPFLLLLLRAEKIADRMRRCQNRSCRTLFFICERRTQKFCSKRCALPFLLQAKRKWWEKHGAEWRKARQRRTKKAPKASKKKPQRRRGK